MLQQGSIDVTTTIPAKLVPKAVTSTGQAITRKVNVEFQSNVVEATCGEEGSQHMFSIDISSNELVDFKESYFRLPFWTWLNNSDATNACAARNAAPPGAAIVAAARTWLDLGGIHALFSKIEIRANYSGTVIQEMDNYNLIVAQLTAAGAFFSAEEKTKVDWDELQLGQFSDDFVPASHIAAVQQDSLEAAAANHNKLYRQVQVRDSQKGLFGEGLATPTTSATAILKRDLIFRPKMSFFEQTEPFPLFLLPGGIKVTFTLADAFVALVRQVGGTLTNGTLGATLGAITNRFKITNPRFVATVLEVDGAIMRDYQRAFESPQGLLFQIPQWKCKTTSDADSRSTGTNNQMFQVGHRSVRRGFGLVQQIGIRGNDNFKYTNRVLSHGLISRIQEYYFSVGSQQFPMNSQRVYPQNQQFNDDEYGQYPSELVHAIELILSRKGLGVSNWEYQPADPLQAIGRRGYTPDVAADYLLNTRYSFGSAGDVAGHLVRATAIETACCQFPVDFRRDNSFLCGVDMSQVQVTWFFNRAESAVETDLPIQEAVPRANPLQYSFIFEHDCLLQVSNAQVSILS